MRKPASSLAHTGLAPENAIDDEALMERFCAGDAKAFDTLFKRYAPPIYGYLRRLVQSPPAAEDLTQATFLSVVRARDRFQSGARFKPWFYSIATNAARDYLRRGRPEQLTEDGDLPSEPAEELPMRDPALERQVQRALAQLPDSQREAIVLHRFEEFSFAEIAIVAGVTESAVKVRAHRGYARLRELLHALWDER